MKVFFPNKKRKRGSFHIIGYLIGNLS
jgi:hypothetical protein